MKVLIFLSDGFDRFTPNNHIYSSVIEKLLKDGHSVHLIESVLSINSEYLLKNEIVNNDNFSREQILSPKVDKHKMIKRYLAGVKYARKGKIAIKKVKKNIDVVLVGSCPTAPFQVRYAKKTAKKPVVYNIQDMFPGSTIAVGAMPNKLMQKFFYWFQKIAYKNADHIVVISDDMLNKLTEQNYPATKISVSNNFYNENTIKPIVWEENTFVKKYNLDKNVFYVQYAGGLGFVFDYKKILYAAAKLKNHGDIVFQIVGSGSQEEKFKQEVKELDLKNIQFLPMQPQSTVAHVYSACSIQVIPLVRGVIGNSVPSKASQVMACEKVIINSVDENTNYFDMFNRYNMGISVSNLDENQFAEAILELYEKKDDLLEMGKAAANYSKENFTASKNVNVYVSVLERLTQ
ncbi:MAG: glycosyltransferase family 4 protein [Bacilli bacterium]|nr:glycosyltransferase family 4 protein [Bacilli bacterium]